MDHPTENGSSQEPGCSPAVGEAASVTSGPPAPEPIAVVGIGCRFPGGIDSPDSFWDLIVRGADGVVDVPAERWDADRFYDPDPTRPGKMYVRRAAFLRDPIDEFDALFFGISPREAELMDPQQRLLLETTWEAMEDAGIPADRLAGSNTGVYIGAFTVDNQLTVLAIENREAISSHTAVSSTFTMLSNRLSYVFDLRGPSMTMDTACSSSLVAMHQACQALWRGECDVALTGGVNVMFRPEGVISMCKGQFLSPDGRSKSFDARADGYGRGEGAGMLVLKPLSAALADGDRVYSVIRATGANQDGRTNGITVPNPDSQQALSREVCRRAGIDPHRVAYIEAHGTGTPVGDPIEARSLGAVYGAGRRDGDTVALGSVKANIGHTEAAAGVAGVIRASLALHHGCIPPLANLGEPYPEIPFADLGLRLPTAPEDLGAADATEPPLAAVNSFGYGGTNAHAILERFVPEPAPATPAEDLGVTDADNTDPADGLLVVSARSRPALDAVARGWADALPALGERYTLDEIRLAAATRRAHHGHRLAVRGATVAELAATLDTFATEGFADRALVGKVDGSADRDPVFVYTGMGPQWWGMGRELLATEPVFRRAVEEVDERLVAIAGWSVVEELGRDEADSRVTETQIAQPANFAIQYGLTALWRSWGIEPAAIVGHSVGEVTAACVAGVLSLDDAVTVSHHRGRIQATTAGQGGMLAVGLPESDVLPLLSGAEGVDGPSPDGLALGGQVSVAAVNSPNSVTLVGEVEALERLAERFEADGVFNRFLTVEVPYHSHFMEPLKPELRESLAGLRPTEPTIPLFSTVTGRPIEGPYRGEYRWYDAEYWCDNVRESVRFADAVDGLLADDHTLFLQVGPHPVLGSSIVECAAAAGARVTSATSLRRGEPERDTMLIGLGELYGAGARIDWTRSRPGPVANPPLPRYPWQRERYWQEAEITLHDRLGNAEAHPLLDRRLPQPEPAWETRLIPGVLPFVADHEVDGVVVFPGAGYVEAALAAHHDLTDAEATVLTDVEFHRALVIGEGEEPVLRTSFDERRRTVRVDSRLRSPDASREGAWTTRATGVISAVAPGRAAPVDLDAVRVRAATPVDVDATYDALDQRGLRYGDRFRRLTSLQRGDGEILARVEPHPDQDRAGAEPGADGAWRLHPTLLDATFQSMIALLEGSAGDIAAGRVFVPVRIDKLVLRRVPTGGFWSIGRLVELDADAMMGHLTLVDDDGEILAEVRGFRCQAIGGDATVAARLPRMTYEPTWVAAEPVEPEARAGTWLVLADEGGVGEAVARDLAAVGTDGADGAGRPVLVRPGGTAAGDGVRTVDPSSVEAWSELLADVGECVGVVHLWGLDLDGGTDGAADATDLEPTLDALDGLTALLRALEDAGSVARLHVVSRGVERVEPDDRLPGLDQAPLVGLARVAVNEYPDQRVTTIDLDGTPATVSALAAELLADTDEDGVALRFGERHVLRLARVPVRDRDAALDAAEPSTVAADEPFELEQSTPGSLDSLVLRRTGRRAPGPGEVEVRIGATALNFKDVAKAMGIMADEALEGTFHGRGLGLEASGMVVRVGEGVTNAVVGDRVIMSVQGCFRRYATLEAVDHAFATITDDLGTPEAAGVSTVFITAYHSLVDVADLRAGERVLIHAAAGGVGLAAVQVAKWLGAEVFGTAGSDEKREYLRSIGVEHVMDSRSLDFAEQIAEITGGEGVDVVLNSLPGEYIHKSLESLAPFGRFVEIGKKDLVEATEISLLPFNRTLTFATVDFDRMMAMRPDRAAELVQKIWARFRAGDFEPVNTTVFPASELVDAFKYMARSQHIGKVAVSFDDEPTVEALPARDERPVFDPDGAHLITGGCGGFGLAMAEWLVERGVRNLVLVGRRGADTPGVSEAVAAMEAAGARVAVVAADITDPAGVAAAMAAADGLGVPLKGVYHAAAVLDDATIGEVDRSRYARVLGPKIVGARLLDAACEGRDLDHFVLFSSVAALIGNARQGNYVAANTWFDAFAERRRARGLPTTSVNWGPIAEVGMAAADEALAGYLELSGFTPTTVADGMEALEHALRWEPTRLGLFELDWLAWSRFEPTSGSSPRFSELVDAGGDADLADHPLHQELAALPAGDRFDVLTWVLVEQIAETLRMPPDRLEINADINDLGMDSLMAVELQTMIRLNMGVEMSVLEMTKGETIAEMAGIVLAKMDLGAGPDVADGVDGADGADAIDGAAGADAASRSATGGAATAPDGGGGGGGAAIDLRDGAPANGAGSGADAVDEMSEAELDQLLESIVD